MEKEKLIEFKRRLADEMYFSTYSILVSEKDKHGVTEELMDLSKILSNKLRGKAYVFAAKKMIKWYLNWKYY